AVIAALLMMKIKKHVHTVHKSPFNELKEGFKYVFESVPLKSIITLMAFVSFAGSGVTILLPVFARDILHGDSMTYGFLTGAVGLGALTGALGMAAKKTLKGLSALMSSAVIVFGAGLFLASFAGNLIMAMALLLFVGAGTMLHMASSNTIIQTVADDDKRGRVISFYILSFSGFLPLGSLVSGWLAKIFGVRHVIAAGGILTALAGVILLFFLPKIRRSLRSVYIKKGIIPSETVVEIK
ncbi:MAG TPA: MFS transporter, partial [Candidatus Goldiibacteriota bacterium]|nr:MFS transporter [Candidatus Goldiibacteriota bacterium]